jgi:hypothetical protein
MTQSKLIIGLALVGAAAAAVWSISTDGNTSKASAAGQASSIGAATTGNLPVAPFHDHGFVFASQP